MLKRKHSTTANLASQKRQKITIEREDSDEEQPSEQQRTRGTTPSFATASASIKHAPIKKQYGKAAKRVQKRRSLSSHPNNASDDDHSGDDVVEKMLDDTPKKINKRIPTQELLKTPVTRRRLVEVVVPPPPHQLAKRGRTSSGPVKVSPIDAYPTPPPTQKKLRQNSRTKQSATVAESEIEEEETTPYPIRTRPTHLSTSTPRRYSLRAPSVTDVTPKANSTSKRKAVNRSSTTGRAALGRMTRRSSARYATSESEEEESPEETPTKPRRAKGARKLLSARSSTGGSSQAVDQPPATDDDVETSEIELNLTISSEFTSRSRSNKSTATSLTRSSLGKRDSDEEGAPSTPPEYYDEGMTDTDPDVFLETPPSVADAERYEHTDDISMSSPKKAALPERLLRFLEPQKTAILQTMRTPPYFEMDDVSGDSKSRNERPALAQLSELLIGTLERGEGNSCLVLGPRRSGKTLLIETALTRCISSPIVIRLSGHAQANDRLAMREIAYQLNHQTDTVFNLPDDEEDEEANRMNAADADEEIHIVPPAAYLPTLISQLPLLKRPVVVILDGFDLFAAHPRQALLYCLLDTVQGCRSGDGRHGLLVIGVSSVVNCVNVLEKRVKSRFSHRIIKVVNPTSFQKYKDVARKVLDVTPSGMAISTTGMVEWRKKWKLSVDNFLSNKVVVETLNETYGLRRDIGTLMQTLIPSVLRLSNNQPWLSPLSLMSKESSHLSPQDEFLSKLPEASMWILVAIYHWQTTGHDAINLKMILRAIIQATNERDSKRLVVNTGDPVVKAIAMPPSMLQAAFEGLVKNKILQPATGSSATQSQAAEFIKYKCFIDRESLRRVVDKHGGTDSKYWLQNAGLVNK